MIGDLPPDTRRKVLLACVGLGAVALLITRNLVLEPHAKVMRVINSQTTLERQKKDLLITIGSIDAQVSGYKDALSGSRETSWLIEELNKMASASEVTLTSAEPGNKEKTGDYQRLTLRLEARGPYHALGEFLSRIESAPRFIKVSSARFEPPPDLATAAPNDLAATMAVSIFYKNREGSS